MKSEYELIKEDYGERFAKFCRSSFPTLIENRTLYKIISDHFAPSKILYNLILEEKAENKFVCFIETISELKNTTAVEEESINLNKSPEELMLEAGYKLYHCKSVEDVMKFKKYYAEGEALCTFNQPQDRLKRFNVFFAVKINVDEIKRENFKSPKRQDEYGTSVISLQFLKDKKNILSIKNRYNHTVSNPDATFHNNLENIIPGLTKSFEEHYKFKNLTNKEMSFFDIYGLVLAKDNKYYVFNYEVNNVYYCENNVILRDFKPIHYDKSRYEIIDYFIFDRKEKCVESFADDGLLYQFKYIEKIDVKKLNDKNKLIQVFNDFEEPISIITDERNRMLYFSNPNCKVVHDYTFRHCEYLKVIKLEKAKEIGTGFASNAFILRECHIPNVTSIRNDFLECSEDLVLLNAPELKIVGDNFLDGSRKLKNLYLPKLEKCGSEFLACNNSLQRVHLPELEFAGEYFLTDASSLKEAILPKLKMLLQYSFRNSILLDKLIIPKCEVIKNNVLYYNRYLTEMYAPALKEIGTGFLNNNNYYLQKLYIPSLEYAGYDFLRNNESLEEFNAPNLKQSGTSMLLLNRVLRIFNAPKLNCNAEMLASMFAGKPRVEFEYFNCPKIERFYSRGFSSKIIKSNSKELKMSYNPPEGYLGEEFKEETYEN